MKVNEKTKNIRLMVQSLIIMIFLAFLVVFAVFYFNHSMAWLSQNTEVNANGASVQLASLGITDTYSSKGVGEAEYTKIEEWDRIFEELMPGDSVSIKAEYENTSGSARTLRVVFSPGSDGETPYIDESGKYYYFGTQLKITSISLNGEKAPGEGIFLMTPPDDKVSFDSEQALPAPIVLAEFDLAARTTASLEITVEFVNLPVDQNAYQGFGGKGQDEKCYRQVIAYVAEKTESA